jgi:hypothetical protein
MFRTEFVGGTLRYIKKPIETGRFTLTMPKFTLEPGFVNPVTLEPLDYCPEPLDDPDFEEYTPFSTELTDYSGID